jgi:acetyltransferase-like isoleucine patch superfamily enzyme
MLFIKLLTLYNLFYLKIKKVTHGPNCRIRGRIKLTLKDGSNFTIGDNFNLNSGFFQNTISRNIQSSIRIDKNASLIIGNDVGMSSVVLWVKENITIGNNVVIGADTIILDSDLHSLHYENRKYAKLDIENTVSKAVTIGNDVFIGTRVIITKGVSIGNRSIVAAGSIVSKNIPEDEIWGGNPVTFIRKLKK